MAEASFLPAGQRTQKLTTPVPAFLAGHLNLLRKCPAVALNIFRPELLKLSLI